MIGYDDDRLCEPNFSFLYIYIAKLSNFIFFANFFDSFYFLFLQFTLKKDYIFTTNNKINKNVNT